MTKSDEAVSQFGYFSEQIAMYGLPFSSKGLGNIANRLDELGDGVFGKVIVFANEKIPKSQGHAFVIARLEGKVKILEGQAETILRRDQFIGWVDMNKAKFGWEDEFHFFQVSGLNK